MSEKKKMWLRAGMTMEVNEKELEKFIENPNENFKKFIKSGKIYFDGESYFPNIEDNEPINKEFGEFTF